MEKINTPTKAKSIRLPNASWLKLRELMQLQGRGWLEKAVDREHKLRVPK
jgi:hypothetical protein